ncbi:MAG: hypothetical protein HYV13_03000 [Candidatus Doudnabacteria bacterium]|nr:hypothetical protein [Candidatus Doudnabacteria bacterium]
MAKCLYCGENPVNHASIWFYGSMDIAFSPLRQKLFFGWFGRKVINNLAELLAWTTFYGLRLLGLVRFNSNIEKIPYKRAKVLLEEAQRRGIEVCEIKPFNLSIDLYQAQIAGKKKIFFGLPRPESIDEAVLDWIDDKSILKQKLAVIGLPVANGKSFRNFREASEYFQTLLKPVVVKPRKGSRGRHTSTFIYNDAQFAEAFKIAKKLCLWVMVEEQLFGDVFRGTVINKQLVGILGGSSPKVTGDGKRTIAQLIEKHNANLALGMQPIKVNPATANYLVRQGYNLNSVLARNQTVTLSEKIGVAYGGTSYDCTPDTHPETKQMILDAAKAVGDPILGFDFMLSDITKSWKIQKAGIIECNGAPFINLHYNPLYGETVNAAKYVWDMMQPPGA